MNLRFKVEETPTQDLEPGSLFSTSGPEHWDKVHLHKCACGDKHSIGAKLYVTVVQEKNPTCSMVKTYRITPYDDKDEAQEDPEAEQAYGREVKSANAHDGSIQPLTDEEELAELAQSGRDQYGSLSQE